jgi:NDP-sugar pyrophosphorylase family protein
MERKFNETKIIILAGGLAKRLRTLTKNKPKSLIKINKLEFIDYQLNWIKKNKFKDVIICCGHLEEKLKNHLEKKKKNLNIKFVSDGKKLLGTGGTVKNCQNYLNDYFFVINGDTYPLININSFKKTIIANNFKSTLLITKNKKKNLINNLKIKKNKIIEYSKNGKLTYDYIDYGIQFFSKKDFIHASKNKKSFDLGHIYKNLIIQNKLFCHKTNLDFYEIGSFIGIKETANYLKKI